MLFEKALILVLKFLYNGWVNSARATASMNNAYPISYTPLFIAHARSSNLLSKTKALTKVHIMHHGWVDFNHHAKHLQKHCIFAIIAADSHPMSFKIEAKKEQKIEIAANEISS
jgi:hypothetical protein